MFSTAANDADDLWPIYGEAGNTATCTAQGFFLQLAVTSIFYNTSLSTYYCLTIVFGCKGTRLKRHFKFLHLVPLTIGFTLAFAGIPFYETNFIVCHLAPPPLADSWAPLTWLLFVPVFAVLFICTALSISVWYKLNRQAQKTSRWHYGRTSFVGSLASSSGVGGGSCELRISRQANQTSSDIDEPSASHALNNSASSVGGGGGCSSSDLRIINSICRQASESRSDRDEPSSSQHALYNSSVELQSSTATTTSTSDRRFPIPKIFRQPSSKMRQLEREVMWQAFIYLFAMYVCWLLFVSLFYKSDLQGLSFPLYCVGSFLMPLQGFFNCLNYFRPRAARYMRQRRRIRKEWRKKRGENMSDNGGKSNGARLSSESASEQSSTNRMDGTSTENGAMNNHNAVTFAADLILEPSAYIGESDGEFDEHLRTRYRASKLDIAEELAELDAARGQIEDFPGEDDL